MSQARTIMITKHDKPIARLVPCAKPSRRDLTDLVRRMDEFCARHPPESQGDEESNVSGSHRRRPQTMSRWVLDAFELALRRGASLASLDGPLRAVARKLGVPLLPEDRRDMQVVR
jgi:antitoxin (DNA-binding transcriptional repressor) of toxin-antitoxin stability system